VLSKIEGALLLDLELDLLLSSSGFYFDHDISDLV
jgi:hypothetical protein